VHKNNRVIKEEEMSMSSQPKRVEPQAASTQAVRIRQEDTVADLQESVRLSNMRYQGGTTTYLEVLDGQRSLFSAELTLAQARGSEYQSLVQLYRALGGGWQ
jgi:outer membrane protein, multidrug efflux system